MSSAAICPDATSVEWRHMDCTTTAFPSEMARSISDSGTPLGSLSVALICLSSSSLARFSGDDR